MVTPELLPRRLREERHFRWRGGEVSRIEGLSDAVFALSLTLLVVALEVPKTSAVLIAVFWQFPAFILWFVYWLMGPVHGLLGYRTATAVERAAEEGVSK